MLQKGSFIYPRPECYNMVEHGLNPGCLVLSMCLDIVLGEWEWFMYHDIVGTMVDAVMHDFM